jgi:hypothetical protein
MFQLQYHTSGTASLSAWALAASVVTVLFANADFENAVLCKGTVRPILNARENMAAWWSEKKGKEGESNAEALRDAGPKDVGPLRWRLGKFGLAGESFIVT